MDFTSTKAIIAYFSAGLVLVVLLLLLGGPTGGLIGILLPFLVTGFALLARRRQDKDR